VRDPCPDYGCLFYAPVSLDAKAFGLAPENVSRAYQELQVALSFVCHERLVLRSRYNVDAGAFV